MVFIENIDIIKSIKSRYSYINSNILIEYIFNLIKKEFLRYNDDLNYFNQNIEDILLNKKTLSTELDYDIDQAIFIILQPFRDDIELENIEQILLKWNGYILNRDINSGEYPQNIIHYFLNDELDFDYLMSMDKKNLRDLLEYEKLVASEKKEKCTKILCNKIKELLTVTNLEDNFYLGLGTINYRFIRIHPYQDGNGRVSRMLLNYMLKAKNLVPFTLDNDEIFELIKVYKKTSMMLHTVFMGQYLKNLEYDDSDYVKTEELFTLNVSNYLLKKEQLAQKQLGIKFKKL